MRMRGHAQHDPAEYVPKEMIEEWKRCDPLDRHEKFLTENKLWNAKTKQEIDQRIARELQADVEFAENSPFPPPELAAEGVYCEGCHTIEADWKRPKEEVMPPRSSVVAKWQIKNPNAAEGPSKRTPASTHSPSGNGASPAPSAKTSAKPKHAKKSKGARVPVKAGH